LKRLRPSFSILVQDNNPDRGTLGDRGRRTSRFSIKDLGDNIAHVATKPDFTRYCNELEEGIWMLASTRPDELSGKLDITAKQFGEIHAKSETFFDAVVLDFGTDKVRGTNLQGLYESDVIFLMTIPAKDRLKQVADGYVWMCKHPELRNKHVVLLVNRKKWWNNLDRIQNFFASAAEKELNTPENRGAQWRPLSFMTVGVAWDPRLAMGLKFTSDQLRRTVRTDVDQALARGMEQVADSFISKPDSQRTHEESQPPTPVEQHVPDRALTDVVRALTSSASYPPVEATFRQGATQ
jgi:hypothetical protein